MPADAKLVREVFLAAAELPVDQRAQYLTENCGDDTELQAAVQRLLAAHDEPASVLARPAPGIPTANYVPISEKPGTKIGPYKLMEQIGEGGFGLVFVAEQTEPVKRRVALKIIKPGMDSQAVIARFEAERQALALMDHPNIARVFDAGATETGRPYFVMELVRGISITDYCDQHQLTPSQRLELFVDVCHAIQHAHQKGVIHRDIKPSNVLVTSHDGKPVAKVIDFGVAKAISQSLTERTIYTQFTQMIGTPLYMSPEQAEMSGLDIDTRSDIYSLGVLLYELLTGSTPLLKKDLATAAYDEIRRLIREEEPPRPSHRLSTCDTLPSVAANRNTEPAKLSRMLKGELDWVVMKALEKDRMRRYETASGLARDVQRYLTDEIVEARPPSAGYRLRKFAKKHRAALTTAAAISLLLLTGATVSTWQAIRATAAELAARDESARATAAERAARAESVRATSAEQEANQERAAAEAAEQKALQARREAVQQRDEERRATYAAAIGLAQRAWQEDNVFRARDLLETAPQEAAGQSLRGFEWDYLTRVCSAEPRTLSHDRPVNGVAFSPDGWRLASGDYDGTVKIWDGVTGKQLLLLDGHGDAVWGLAFSPDGQRLASGSHDGTVKIWDGATGKELLSLDHPTNVRCVVFSPDGQRLASGDGGDDGTVKIWDAATGQALLSFKGHPGVFAVAFSPDGGRLASAGWDETVKLWDSATGKELALEGVSGGHTVAFSPDGRRLASGGWHEPVKLWDSVTGKELPSCGDDSREVNCVAFSPDGRRLASGGRNGAVKLWDIATGRHLVSLQGHTGDVMSVVFSPDGQRLASASHDGTVRVWDGATGAEPLSLRNPTPWTHSESFANGRRVATVMSDPTPEFWNSATGKELLSLMGPVNGLYQGVAFSPDGRLLASAGLDKTVKIYDLRHTINRRLTMRSGSPEKTVMQYDSASGKELLSLEGHANTVLSVAFSPDGGHLASGDYDGTVKIWDSATGHEQSTLKGHTRAVYGVAFSPDGKLLASGSWDKTVKVWDTAAGEERLTLKGHTDVVYGVAFSPDGRQLASGSLDSTARVWDSATGQEQFTLKGHSAAVYGVAFSPDGRRLASGSSDQTVKVWDTSIGRSTGRELLSFKGHAGEVYGVAFSPDGWLAAANEDRTTSVWETTTVAPEVQDRRAARALVAGLFEQMGLRADVLDRLRTLPWTSATRRQEALAAAEAFPENPGILQDLAWKLLKVPGHEAADYRQALRLIEPAFQLNPENALYLTTLGMAHYRLGNDDKALEMLLRADQIEEPQPEGPIPALLAFLAMTRHRLGQAQEAQAVLERLRECLKDPLRARDAEAQSFLREAEAVLAKPGP